MRFLMTPVGSSGDVHPYIGIGRRLCERGHTVVVMTAGKFEDVVVRSGLEFRATISAEEFDRVTRDPQLWHPRKGLAIVMSEMARWLRPAYDLVAAAYEPGTVLVGHGLSLATRLFEEKHGAPAATLQLAPSVFRSDYGQQALTPGGDISKWPRWVRRSMWWAIDRYFIDPTIAPQLNSLRGELSLPRIDRVMYEWFNSPKRVIGLFPEWFAPRQPDWPAALRLTGFPLYDESDQQPVIPSTLERFLSEGPPPIVFTPGSANQVAESFFRESVAAAQIVGRRALLLTRYSTQLPPLSEGIHYESYVPFSTVLPRCAAIVHHGGIGTLAQGLAAGIPQLTMPLGFDQPDNATRLGRLGVGRWVVPSEFNRHTVAETLSSLLNDPRVAQSCAQWKRQVRQEHAIDRTCDLLEQVA
ncbi:MAG TPA: glycosyltransferase [Vicinamibacterales bacterium]|jgi:UDP:flavonoid glycosyltransferase YjiC (YdhE family)